MNAEQRLEWIAEHIHLFRPGANSTAYMRYINAEGEGEEVTFKSEEHDPSCLALLNGCVDMAILQEQKKGEVKNELP